MTSIMEAPSGQDMLQRVDMPMPFHDSHNLFIACGPDTQSDLNAFNKAGFPTEAFHPQPIHG